MVRDVRAVQGNTSLQGKPVSQYVKMKLIGSPQFGRLVVAAEHVWRSEQENRLAAGVSGSL